MARQTMFKNLTIREKYILLLKLIYSGKVTDTRSNRTCLEARINGAVRYVFLGKSGGIRVADRNAYTASFDKSAGFKAQLAKVEAEGTMQRLYEAGQLTLD